MLTGTGLKSWMSHDSYVLVVQTVITANSAAHSPSVVHLMLHMLLRSGKKEVCKVWKRFRHLTCEKEKDKDHNHRVAEVQDGASGSNNLQLGEEVMYAIDKQVDRCEATGQEGTPPPVIILDTVYKTLESPTAKWSWSNKHTENICSACSQGTIKVNNFLLEYVWEEQGNTSAHRWK